MNEAIVYEKSAVNRETGEIISYHKYSMVYYSAEKGYLFFNKRGAVKTFNGIDLPETLKDEDIGKLYKLSKKTFKTTNMLMYRSHNTILPMQAKHIAKTLGITEKYAKMFIRKMINSRIMAKVTVKNSEFPCKIQYYMNPIYFFNGKYLNLNLYLLFKDDLDMYLPQWVKDKFYEGSYEHDKEEKERSDKCDKD